MDNSVFKVERFTYDFEEEVGEQVPGWNVGELQSEVNRASPDYIRWVQASLNQILGLRLVEDGKMGTATRSAIRSFQQKNGLTVDGLVGPKTEAALVAAGARPMPGGSQKGGSQVCGKPVHMLQRFHFDQSSLVRDPSKGIDHFAEIEAVAKRIVGSWRGRHPVRSVCLRGHTDERGAQSYNVQLGLRRAQTAEAALRDALRRESARVGHPDIAARISITSSSAGEGSPAFDNRTEEGRSKNRRVEIAVAAGQPGTGKTIPPDPPPSRSCGVPDVVPELEAYLDYDFEDFETGTRARRVTVRPALCLFQNASVQSHRNHFHHQATRWARHISAFAEPNAAACKLRVGPTQYDTGADIVRAIEATYQCLGNRRVKVVHIFSHSGSYGVFGTLSSGAVGMYQTAPDASSRQAGARAIADIPTSKLAQDVVFVLHGCNQASDDDNFAHSLYDHLAAALKSPKVFGHYNSGCAGRDNSWKEYSTRFPLGRRVGSISPHYSGSGGCSRS